MMWCEHQDEFHGNLRNFRSWPRDQKIFSTNYVYITMDETTASSRKWLETDISGKVKQPIATWRLLNIAKIIIGRWATWELHEIQ